MRDFTEISQAFSKSGNRELLVENSQLNKNNEVLTNAFVGLSLVVVLAAGYYVYKVIKEERRKRRELLIYKQNY